MLLSMCSVLFWLALTGLLLMFFSCSLHRHWFKIKISPNFLKFKWNLLQEFTSGASISKIIEDLKKTTKQTTSYSTCKTVIYQVESCSFLARCFYVHLYWENLIDNFLLLMGECWTQMFSITYTFLFSIRFYNSYHKTTTYFLNCIFTLTFLIRFSMYFSISLLVFPLKIKASVRSFEEGFLKIHSLMIKLSIHQEVGNLGCSMPAWFRWGIWIRIWMHLL